MRRCCTGCSATCPAPPWSRSSARRARSPAPTGSRSCSRSRSSPRSSRPAGGVEALLAARIAVVEGDLADVPALPTRPRRRRALRRRRVVRPADRRGVHHQRDRHPRPARPDRRGAGRDRPRHPLRAHLDGVRRGPAPRQHPRGVGRARRRLASRAAPWGLRPARRRSSTAPAASTCWSRSARRPRRSTAAPGCSRPRRATEAARKRVGQGRAGPDRHRAGPQPRLDRLLHVHQGDGRAGRRGARAGEPHRASIVRPSIIESALRAPYPGWIEGFKMAEPLILAYGRGELPEFPAAPDSVVDIVPVDHVVGAIVAVLAHRAGAGEAGVLPRLLRRPQPADLPACSTTLVRDVLRPAPVRPGRARRGPAAGVAVPRRATRSSGCSSTARRALQGRRLRGRPRPAQRPDPRAAPASSTSRSAGWSSCAATSTSTGVRHGRAAASSTTTTLALLQRARPATTRRRSRSTPRSSTGTHYLQRRALPGRHRAAPPATTCIRSARNEAAGRARPRSSGRADAATPRCAAFFDMDGTLLSSQRDRDLPVDAAARARRHRAGRARSAGSLRRCRASSRPSAATAATFLRAIYREYEGADLDELDRIVDEHPRRPRAGAALAPPPYAGSASTARPGTRPC